MGLPHESLQEQMSIKSAQDLYDIVHFHSQDYLPETIEAAHSELSRRQLDAPTLSSIVEAAEKEREKEEAHLSWPLKILAFFISTAILFIPVLWAYTHFVEKGERRKAREWARWAIYGFVFYCVIGLLLRMLAPKG